MLISPNLQLRITIIFPTSLRIMSSASLCYTRDELLRLRSPSLPISRTVKRKLWYHRLLRSKTPPSLSPTHCAAVIKKQPPSFPLPVLPRQLLPLPRADRHNKPACLSLKFGLLNIRSLANKVDDVIAIQREHAIHVLLLVETWHDSDSVSLQRMRSARLTVLERARPRKRADSLLTNHGGVVAIASPNVKMKRLTFPSPSTFECLAFRITSRSASAVIIQIYRTGPVSTLFFNELSNIIDLFITLTEPLFIAGDLNIHVENRSDPHANTLLQLLQAYGLVCHVRAPTHDRGGTLDLVVSRADLPAPPTDILDLGLSDHCLVVWHSSLPRPLPVYRAFMTRPWRFLSNLDLRSAIANSAICVCPSPSSNIDELADLFDSELVSVLDEVAPLKSVRCRIRPSDPWFDQECKTSKQNVRRIERRIKRSVDPDSVDILSSELKECRRQYKQLTRLKREAFWKTKTDSEKNNPRLAWSSINAILGRSQINPNTNISAQAFLQHTIDKVSSIHEITSDSPAPVFSTAPSDCELNEFRPLELMDVINALTKLPSKPNSRDPLPPEFLKSNIDLVAPFIHHLFNLSLSSGSFPRAWKEAVINPILKKGNPDSNEVSSYRPISKLCTLSKVLERHVALQLSTHVNSHGLFPQLQSAYRPHHSTETALLKVSTEILTAIDQGETVILSLLDLSSAFDSVNHDILLRRLQLSFGINGHVLSWIRSFLSDRTQIISCETSVSLPSPTRHGVPQGSVLGPLLFLMYTADIPKIIESHDLSYHLYADDIQIFGSCHPSDSASLASRLSRCIADIHNWLCSNRLLLNASKTEVMWLTSQRRRHLAPTHAIVIGDSTISPVSQVRSLGVLLDPCLTMRPYICDVTSKCFSALRQLRSIRRCISEPVANTLVTALIHSKLHYCSTLLYGLPDNSLSKFQFVLNASCRLVCNSRARDHVTPLLESLEWLPIRNRINFRLAVLIFKCLHDLAPPYLVSHLQLSSSITSRRSLRSSSSSNLLIPSTRLKTVGARAFPTAAARVWNSLPSSLKSISSLSTFKTALKSELLRRSYS